MKRISGRLSRSWVCAATALVLLAAGGCNSRSSQRKREEAATNPSPASTAQSSSGRGIDMNCVIDQIQNPTEKFHYFYKKDAATPAGSFTQEADITPDTIDGTRKSGDSVQTFHGVRTDPQNWQSAWVNLTGISGMSSTIAIVANSSAMVREGQEQMNGYDTTRYSIDTSRASTAEAALYRATLGDGGSEKGTAWVTAKGCPAKFSLDVEMHLRNGTVDKTHYEVEMVKK